jgi:polyribonucleotide nucleotidyltransferase
LADFGAFVEILPGLDGLLHISEVAEHRIKDVRDELKEGDQVLVKVLAVEGNRIKLSRKAILKEQRAKMTPGGSPPPPPETDAAADLPSSGPAPAVPQGAPTAVIEGGAEFDADEEPNFNRVDGVVASVEAGAARPEGAREGRPSGDRDRNRRRRGRGRGPGGGQGGHGGGHSGGGGGRGRR